MGSQRTVRRGNIPGTREGGLSFSLYAGLEKEGESGGSWRALIAKWGRRTKPDTIWG